MLRWNKSKVVLIRDNLNPDFAQKRIWSLSLGEGPILVQSAVAGVLSLWPAAHSAGMVEAHSPREGT